MADAALTPEERDTLAAEFALGVLEGEERAQALRLQLSDAGFREAVGAWEFRLGQLYNATAEVTPPNLWPVIEARLPQGGAANNNDGGAVIGMTRRLQLWRTTSLLSGAAAAALAILVVTRPGPQAPAPIPAAPATTAIVAKLGEGNAPAQLVANYDPDKGEMRIRAIQLPPSGNLSPELWVIPAGGAPSSLGLVAAQGATSVKVSATLRQLLKDGATLAVTMEPREGAPHAAPSSTPIAAGTMHML